MGREKHLREEQERKEKEGEKEGAGAREERKAEGVLTRWPGCHWKDSEDTIKRD